MNEQEAMTAEYTPASFDPLSTVQIANTICETFERQPLVSMAYEIPRFEGSGLYALYYRGHSVDLYLPLASLQIPVYAGQALSSNSATGERVRERYPLHSRLKQHRLSILEGGLPITEFRFRALLLPDVHADLGENALRVGYQPVWNSKLKGFGSKEQGSTTRQSKKSKWDTVHDGRRRTHGGVIHDVEKLKEQVRAHIAQQVSDYDERAWPHPSADKYLDLDVP
ncbi:Eco29kI family restriction endonuclease [Actinoallomurus purpureus]|uniref:Eco29kI family restriction endonuclease n=1 Tax=Actinoallomurus purpureus TaxID=478114 RepID=UPI0020928E6E|nr:Eco29kI family restriction endonuclease [Actinoallomurus purpureus]MCO6009267.1 Eco29kI family restriction endonuclease [Actinoallomurus purpureus]